MNDQSSESNGLREPGGDNAPSHPERPWHRRRNAQRAQDNPFPPRLTKSEVTRRSIGWVFLLAGLLYVIEQLCLARVFPSLGDTFPAAICATYIALGFVLVGVGLILQVLHMPSVYKGRLEDRSEVEALFVEVRTTEPRLPETNACPRKPDNYVQKKNDLDVEVHRLEDIGYRGWTEYQVLALHQMLVDFLKVDDLIASARLRLAELEEYADDSATRYDWETFCKWEQHIDDDIEKIENLDREDRGGEGTDLHSGGGGVLDRDVARDAVSEKLRAHLRALFEHVADYGANWAEGSAVVRGLMIYGVIAIPFLLAMGLLPILHPEGGGVLNMFNWGLLAVGGAITAELLSLRKSNLVDVGDSEGKKTLWNAVLGCALGLVAGILAYSMIAGGVLGTGSIVPNVTSAPVQNVTSGPMHDIGLSILWAVASGFCFESLFDRMSAATLGKR